MSNFLKHSKLDRKFKKPKDETTNICYLNSTRKETSMRCVEQFIKEHKSKNVCTLKFKYNGGVERYRVCPGMLVIATANLKELDLLDQQCGWQRSWLWIRSLCLQMHMPITVDLILANNYAAVFEDGGQIIFLHISIYIIRRSSSNIFLRKSKPYKVYYTLQKR